MVFVGLPHDIIDSIIFKHLECDKKSLASLCAVDHHTYTIVHPVLDVVRKINAFVRDITAREARYFRVNYDGEQYGYTIVEVTYSAQTGSSGSIDIKGYMLIRGSIPEIESRLLTVYFSRSQHLDRVKVVKCLVDSY